MARITQGLRKGHRPFREPWKRGQRRARDALPAIRQSQLNLAWARARSQKKKPPSKHSKQTLEILENVLRDPILSAELDQHAGYKLPQEVPPDALEALRGSLRELGAELISMRSEPEPSRPIPQLAVCLDRSLSDYDRNDLAVALQELGFSTQVTRHGVHIVREELDLEVLMGPASELLSQKRGGFCPFPCSHLTVAENWREADQLGQEQIQNCGEMRWALDLTKHFSGQGLPSLAIRGKSQKGPVVFELVLRHLALRIQDRDAESLRRFKAALAGQCDGSDEGHSLGCHLVLSIAKELLEWSKSGLLGLWLKDAELYAGERGKAQAKRLLSPRLRCILALQTYVVHRIQCGIYCVCPIFSPPDAAAAQLETEAWAELVTGVSFLHQRFKL
ncbi:unnamed protein product [Durusdinium trenchii]|uniref:Uncharacterized protein n=1 Tax=Durusdinium trenchii TaxID=1381693 RepID=A0ABP0LP68_9DINO